MVAVQSTFRGFRLAGILGSCLFLSVFLNRGDATFAARRDYQTASGNYGVTICDVDRDGRLDAITANYRDRSICLLRGNGDGTFREPDTTRKTFDVENPAVISGE